MLKVNIIQKIKDQLPFLTESETQVANYVIKHPNEVVKMNVTELGRATNTSASTIVRFCKSVGQKGFPQLKIQLSIQNSLDGRNTYTDISPTATLSDIKNHLSQDISYYISETNLILDDEAIDPILDLLMAAQIIFVYGIGASNLVAMDISQKFARVGKVVVHTEDSHELVASMGIRTDEAVFIGISNSGETQEIIEMTKLATQLGIKTIGLTSQRKNRLQHFSDYQLLYSQTREVALRSGATLSLINQLYLVDVVFLRFITRNYEDIVEKLELSRQAIEQLVDIKKGNY